MPRSEPAEPAGEKGRIGETEDSDSASDKKGDEVMLYVFCRCKGYSDRILQALELLKEINSKTRAVVQLTLRDGDREYYYAALDKHFPGMKERYIKRYWNAHVDETGYVLFYTNQCPYPAKYVPIIENIANEHGVEFRSIHITDRDTAQNAPTPVTNYALFYNGEYVSNEILSDKKFLKLIDEG